MRRLLTVPETAERLGCKERHVYNLIAAGKLRPTDIALGPRSRTRIADTEVERFITESTRTVPAA